MSRPLDITAVVTEPDYDERIQQMFAPGDIVRVGPRQGGRQGGRYENDGSEAECMTVVRALPGTTYYYLARGYVRAGLDHKAMWDLLRPASRLELVERAAIVLSRPSAMP